MIEVSAGSPLRPPVTLLSAVDFTDVRELLQGEEHTVRVTVSSHLSKAAQSSS